MSKKQAGNKDIDDLIASLLKKAKLAPLTGEGAMSVDEKLKILDRAIKNEALKAKLGDGDFGTGFDENDDE
jgi:hypothetical protein